MARICVLGAPGRVAVWALAGALVRAVDTEEQARSAYRELSREPGHAPGEDVAVVIVTPQVARALAGLAGGAPTVVLP